MPFALSSRRLALLSGVALLSLVGVASICSAETPGRSLVPPAPPYRVRLEAPDGTPLPTFQHAGVTFVLGEAGDRYRIRVDNPTAERVEVVVTVDGRDAISGDLGDYVRQRGYLIEPWGNLLVEGFRRSLDEVATFRFSDREDSYSARRGTARHVGVIGVAVFPERRRPPRPVWRRSRSEVRDRPLPESQHGFPARPSAARDGDAPPIPAEAPRPSADERAPRERGLSARKSAPNAGPSNIGTRYGEDRASSVVEVAFERRSPDHPSALLTLRYDDYDGLAARGIDLSSLDRGDIEEPQPFPLSRRFAPPP